SSLVRSGLAPALSSSFAIPVLLRVAAQASAVVPSPSRAFTSTLWPSSAATEARSSFRAASMSASPPARARAMPTHTARTRVTIWRLLAIPLHLEAVQSAGAVAELLGGYAHLVKHGEVEIRQGGGVSRITDVA